MFEWHKNHTWGTGTMLCCLYIRMWWSLYDSRQIWILYIFPWLPIINFTLHYCPSSPVFSCIFSNSPYFKMIWFFFQLLAADPALKRFKSHKQGVRRLKVVGDVLTVVVVAGMFILSKIVFLLFRILNSCCLLKLLYWLSSMLFTYFNKAVEPDMCCH